ncbi:MAG: hypothetical protein IT463_14055 [Planctomycetes bacterium]|nr:hypothetical protein [Planctomycetota bacterium]
MEQAPTDDYAARWIAGQALGLAKPERVMAVLMGLAAAGVTLLYWMSLTGLLLGAFIAMAASSMTGNKTGEWVAQNIPGITPFVVSALAMLLARRWTRRHLPDDPLPCEVTTSVEGGLVAVAYDSRKDEAARAARSMEGSLFVGVFVMFVTTPARLGMYARRHRRKSKTLRALDFNALGRLARVLLERNDKVLLAELPALLPGLDHARLLNEAALLHCFHVLVAEPQAVTLLPEASNALLDARDGIEPEPARAAA